MGSRLPGMWLEYVLIFILVVIVIATVNALFGPYIREQITSICLQYGLPCPGVPTATPTPIPTPTPTPTMNSALSGLLLRKVVSLH